jgi:hypothetical protein
MSWLTKAGNFNIEFQPMPFFNEPAICNPPTAVLHTTECTFEEALTIFNQHYAPHFLLGRDRTGAVRIIQMVPIGFIGASLKANNRFAMAQVEMVEKSRPEPWFTDDGTALALASLMATFRKLYGIPLTRPWPDNVFSIQGGLSSHRNGGEFGSIPGWFGHGDVPNPPDDHWDPGAFLWNRAFSLAESINI